MSATLWFALATALLAVITDLRSRRIPNLLTFGSAAAGLIFHSFAGSPLASLGGWAVGLAVFLPVYVLRGLGAGDVKLLAALGAWLGPSLALWTGLFGAIAGGVLAVAVTLRERYFVSTLKNLWLLLSTWRVTGVRPVDGLTLQTSRSPRLPYAIPILAGLVIASWLK